MTSHFLSAHPLSVLSDRLADPDVCVLEDVWELGSTKLRSPHSMSNCPKLVLRSHTSSPSPSSSLGRLDAKGGDANGAALDVSVDGSEA